MTDAAAPKNVLRAGSDDEFNDPLGAKIEIVVRGHGPALVDPFYQINYLNGGCTAPVDPSAQSTWSMPGRKNRVYSIWFWVPPVPIQAGASDRL